MLKLEQDQRYDYICSASAVVYYERLNGEFLTIQEKAKREWSAGIEQ